jgi:hypothetical protein
MTPLPLTSKRVVLAAGAVMVFAAGCLGYTTYAKIDPSEEGRRRLDRAELARITSALDRVLRPLGMVPHPEMEHVRKVHREMEESPFLVLEEWINAGSGTADDVEVFIKEDKHDGSVAVVIRNRTWPRATTFTDALETEVRAALADAIPDREIVIDRRVEGPSFSP